MVFRSKKGCERLLQYSVEEYFRDNGPMRGSSDVSDN